MFSDNKAQSRFELIKEGSTAYADYRQEGAVLHLLYVFAPPELRGTGAAGELMQHVTRHAREQGLKINPVCGYAASWLRKHKETHDLLA